jgi:large subunit ribosomal protein L22
LNSALANAKNNFQIEKEGLYIKEVTADEGPVLKRWRPRAFGRAAAIRKRSTHISLILEEEVVKFLEKKK